MFNWQNKQTEIETKTGKQLVNRTEVNFKISDVIYWETNDYYISSKAVWRIPKLIIIAYK